MGEASHGGGLARWRSGTVLALHATMRPPALPSPKWETVLVKVQGVAFHAAPMLSCMAQAEERAMNIDVAPQWGAFIETMVKEGRCASAAAAVDEWLRLLQEREGKLACLRAARVA